MLFILVEQLWLLQGLNVRFDWESLNWDIWRGWPKNQLNAENDMYISRERPSSRD